MIDIKLNEGAPTENRDEQLIIQQVDMLFDTNRKEVFGADRYGTNYEEFLHNLNVSNDAVAYQIEADLNGLDLFGYTPHVEVYFLEGTMNDIMMVQITLSKGSIQYEKTYTVK